MAYVPSQLDAEGDEQKRLNISGSGASTGTAAGTGAGNQPIAPSGSSGSFTNIRDYLGANQAGAAGLGQTVSGKINKEAGEAESAISSGETGVRGKITAGTNAYDQTSLDQTISTGQAHDTTRRNLTGTYAGPTSLAEYRPNIDRELTEAKDVAGLAGTAGGRVELLRTLTGRPQTTGVTRLNSALLQGNEQARGMVAGAVQRVNPLTGRLETAEQATARAAEEAAATNRAVRERTVGGLNTYLTGQETEADARLVELRNRETARAQAARDYLTRLGAVGQRAPLEEGRAQAGGSGGLVNLDTLAGRVSALSAPTEQRAQIASVPVTAPRATIAAAPTEGRATIQRVASRYYADGGDGGAYRGDGGGFVGPTTPVTMVPGGAVPTTSIPPSQAVPAVGGGVVSANPPSVTAPGYIVPVGPVPVEQLELVSGFEQAGLTEAQARELQNSVAQNAREGGVRVDLTQYYTPAQIDGLTRAAVITPEQAARYTALANLAGREGSYQSMAPDLNGATNIAGARSAISAKYEAARQWNAERAAAATAEANRVAEANRLAAEAQAARDAAAAAQAARDAAARQAAIDAANQYNNSGGPGDSGPGNGDGGVSSGVSSGEDGPGGTAGAASGGGTAPGTGGGAAAAASAAAAAAAAAGHGEAAIGAASQAAADASVAGMSADAAAAAAADAANSVSAQADSDADANGTVGDSDGNGVSDASEGDAVGSGDGQGDAGSSSSSSADAGPAGADAGVGVGASGDSAGVGDSAGSGDGQGDAGSSSSGDSAGDGSGGGGGGGGGGCVMATALVAQGGWAPTQKSNLIQWCEANLHNNVLGETFRRGYQVLGAKIGVPALRRGGLAAKYYGWTFNEGSKVIQGKSLNPVSVLHSALWFTAVMATGAVVSKAYAKRTWKSLYKPKDNE